MIFFSLSLVKLYYIGEKQFQLSLQILLKNIINNEHNIHFLLNKNLEIKSYNFTVFHKLSRDFLYGKSIESLIYKEDSSMLQSYVEQLDKEGVDQNFEITLQGKKGDKIYTLSRLMKVNIKDIQYIYLHSVDISEMKKKEKSLVKI